MALRALKTEEEIAGIPLDQEILVELPSATVPDEEPEVTETKKTEIDPAAKSLQDQLEELKRQSSERTAKAEREAAEAKRQLAEREREFATRTQALEGDIINGGLAAAQNERDAAIAEYVRAGEAGDLRAQALAQSKIGRAEAKILSLESGAAEIAERKAAPAQQEVRQAPQQVDPIAAIDANPQLLPAEKDWLKAHPDAVLDQRRNNELSVAYERAIKKDLVRGTPAYFSYLEEFMGYRQPSTDNSSGDTIVQAPPSRNERGGDGRPSGNTIRLSAEQREIARNLGITDIEYAKQVAAFDSARKADPDRFR